MDYGIQRRSIYLVPVEDHELLWLFHEFDRDEVWQMFGLPGPGRLRVMRAYRTGDLVVGIIRRVADRKRIGFVVLFPPNGDFDFWELGYAISDPRDRDAFSALNATDAAAHYMFDHCRVEALGWRTRADNRAADAVVRRLGYQPFGRWAVDGHDYTFYRLDQAGWARRRAKLEAGEQRAPSGLGEVFVTLLERPFTPREPAAVPERAEPEQA
jgi:RimJ/RimL family protein N-acetyltransferase